MAPRDRSFFRAWARSTFASSSPAFLGSSVLLQTSKKAQKAKGDVDVKGLLLIFYSEVSSKALIYILNLSHPLNLSSMQLPSKPTFLILTVLSALLLAAPANAWSPAGRIRHLLSRPRRSRMPTTSKVEASSLAFTSGVTEEEIMATTATMALPSLVRKNAQIIMPNKWDLPRHSASDEDTRRAKLLWDAELVTGRVAMIAAMSLMIGEATTGHSVAMQVMDVLAMN